MAPVSPDLTARLVIEILLNVIGGLGIFLLGMKNMSEGLQSVAGDRLRRVIGSVTDNRCLGVLSGLFVTLIVQSSTITTVMTVGLVNSGFMTLAQSIGVIFGANIGTTITGWILTLEIGKYGLPLLGVSALLFLFARRDRYRYLGLALVGIGMIFFGLELMSTGFRPLRTLPEFRDWFKVFAADTYLGVLMCMLVGCVLTLIVQSSSATLGITMGLAMTGVIPFETAAALVLGENVGTTITAWLASLGVSTQAKRAAYAHIVFNLLGALWISIIFLPFYLPFIRWIVSQDPNTMRLVGGEETFPYILRSIALVHTVFNVGNTLLFLPFTGLIARLVTALAPERAGETEPNRLRFIDVRGLNAPELGIVQSGKELGFMAQSVDLMFGWMGECLQADTIDPELRRKLNRREEILDAVHQEVVQFLSRLVSGQVSHGIMDRARWQLRQAHEFESISDYLARALKGLIKLKKAEAALTPVGRAEILEIHAKTAQFFHAIHEAMLLGDTTCMRFCADQGREINRQIKQSRRNHLVRLAEHDITPVASLVFMELLADYKRMRDHTINVAETVAKVK